MPEIIVRATVTVDVAVEADALHVALRRVLEAPLPRGARITAAPLPAEAAHARRVARAAAGLPAAEPLPPAADPRIRVNLHPYTRRRGNDLAADLSNVGPRWFDISEEDLTAFREASANWSLKDHPACPDWVPSYPGAVGVTWHRL